MVKVLITGAAGSAGQAVTRLLAREGLSVRLADITSPVGPGSGLLGTPKAAFVRCDTRTPDDVRRAVEGVDAVVHLAAWHSAHQPPVSDATIFAVNVVGGEP